VKKTKRFRTSNKGQETEKGETKTCHAKRQAHNTTRVGLNTIGLPSNCAIIPGPKRGSRHQSTDHHGEGFFKGPGNELVSTQGRG